MMNKQRLTAISLTLAIALGSPLASAKNEKNKGHKGKPQHVAAQNEKASQSHDRYFNDDHRTIIRDYYDRHYHDRDYRESNRANLPPGLQKKYERTGQLPPGWAKKVNRGDVLPIDIYHHGHEVPYDLRRRLPIGPIGSKIIEVEGKIIRIMENTREIIDIIDMGF